MMKQQPQDQLDTRDPSLPFPARSNHDQAKGIEPVLKKTRRASPPQWIVARRSARPSPHTHKWCRTCGKPRNKARGRCQYCARPQDYFLRKQFLPLFVSAQTNRMRHVFNEMVKQGIPIALGDQWQPYVSYTVDLYFADWYDFFQRGESKVIKCAGPLTADFALAVCEQTPPVAIEMWRSTATVSRALARVDMDHSVPKTLIFDAWRRRIAKHSNRDFKRTCHIEYLNHLLFSVKPHPQWGAPMVVPRCSGHCHTSPTKQARLLGNALDGMLQIDR
jgi:hypothetical protein